MEFLSFSVFISIIGLGLYSFSEIKSFENDQKEQKAFARYCEDAAVFKFRTIPDFAKAECVEKFPNMKEGLR